MSKAAEQTSRLDERIRQAEMDASLLLGVTAGKEEELELLYDAYAPMLLALAMKMLRSISDAEEIVQELFQDMWRNTFAAMDGTVNAWMVSSMRERALARLRARGHRRQHHVFDPQSVSLLPENAHLSGTGSERHEIMSALRKVGREEQQALALAFYEGFTESEIAEIVHRPVSAVRSQIGSALLALFRSTPWRNTTAPPHEGFSQENLVGRALLALDGSNAHALDAHLALPCEACFEYLRGLKETAALLPALLTPVPPSPDLKERILFSIRLSKLAEEELERPEPTEPMPAPEPPPPAEAADNAGRSPWLIIAGIFVALLILVGLAAYVNTLIDKVSAQYAFIQGQEVQLAELKSDLSGKKGVSMVLDSPRLQIVPLKGVPPGVESRGNLFWDLESNRAFLRVLQLPEAPDDMEYRLWIGLKDKSILRSELTSVLGPDSTRTYLTVIRMPDGPHERVDFVAVVRVKKDAEIEATGEMCLQGTVVQPGQVQRTK